MKETAKRLSIAQGNCITYMTADLTLVHLKILMTIIKELQKPVQAMIADRMANHLTADSVLPPEVPVRTVPDSCQISRKVTISMKDVGLGVQNNRYLLSCLANLREKTCVFPSNPGNPARSDRILVTGLISHFTYDQTTQKVDVYLMDIVARKLLLVRDGFTRYDYLQAMSFSNKYTVRMYWIINSWRGRQGFRITMKQLRYVMSAEDKYPRDDNFISKVVKVAYDELREKGDIWFQYSRDSRKDHDVFSVKVYQRITEEEREAIVKKTRDKVFMVLARFWKMNAADCSYAVGKITADNHVGYMNHLKHVTESTDIKGLKDPSSYVLKSMNSYLSKLDPIDGTDPES